MKYNNNHNHNHNHNRLKKQVINVFFIMFSFYMIFLHAVYPIFQHKNNNNIILTTSIDVKTSSFLDICHHYDIDQLSSLIWSHRATSSSLLSITTSSSLEYLLKNGITNYDIDISINNNNNKFIVAHPSQLSSSLLLKKDEYLTIENFLNIINNHMIKIYQEKQLHLKDLDDKDLLEYTDSKKNIHTIPFITLEPKFNNQDNSNEFQMNLKELINIISISPLNNSCAIIATTIDIENSLRKLLPYSSNIKIARAYRSKPVTNGHIWINKINSIKNNNDNNIKVIHMPDKILINNNIKRMKTDDQVDTIDKEFIISWLIDDEESLWQQLDFGVDSIISNKPIELLNILIRNYEKNC